MSFGLGAMLGTAAQTVGQFIAPVTDALGITTEAAGAVTDLAGVTMDSIGQLQAGIDAGSFSAEQIAEIPQNILGQLNFSNVSPGELGTAVGGTLGTGGLNMNSIGDTQNLLNGTQATRGLGSFGGVGAGAGKGAGAGNFITDYAVPGYGLYEAIDGRGDRKRAADQAFAANQQSMDLTASRETERLEDKQRTRDNTNSALQGYYSS